MNNANGVAALALGLYLIAVSVKGNARPLWALIAGDAGFIKWGVAAGLLTWIASRKEVGEVGAGLIMVAVIGMAIRIANDPTLLGSITKAWAMLPTPSTSTGATGSF